MKRAYGVTVKELARVGREVQATLRSDMGFRIEGVPPSAARRVARAVFLEKYGQHYYVRSCSGQGPSIILYVVAGSPPVRPEPGVVWRKPPATPRGKKI